MSRIYDEYPRRSCVFDAALFGYAERLDPLSINPDRQIDASGQARSKGFETGRLEV